jgi:hypothetical protein
VRDLAKKNAPEQLMLRGVLATVWRSRRDPTIKQLLEDLGSGLCQLPEPAQGVAELPLQHSESVLHLGPYAGLDLLDLLGDELSIDERVELAPQPARMATCRAGPAASGRLCAPW